MSQLSSFQLGLQAQQNQNYEQALTFYNQVLEGHPNYEQALNNKGLIYLLNKDYSQAQSNFEQVLAIDPTHGESLFNLGTLYQQQSDFHQAIEYYQQVLQVNSNHLNSLYNLGTIYELAYRDYPQAINYYQQCLTHQPNFHLAHLRMAKLYHQQANYLKAIEHYLVVLKLKPELVALYNNLGVALLESGQFNEAETILLSAAQKIPNSPQILANLGNLYLKQQRWEKAKDFYQQALANDPQNLQAYQGLGNVYKAREEHFQAIQYFEKALTIQPTADLYNNLALSYQSLGLVEKSLELFERALDLKPSNSTIFSNWLFCLRVQPHYSHQAILEAANSWDKRMKTQPLQTRLKVQKSPVLKIGYLSPDFCHHSAAQVFELLYQHHDRRKVEIYSYAHITQRDDKTERFKQLSDHWFEIDKMTDFEVFTLIQRHELDILVDLAGHTKNNRLKVFALKPTAIQMTGLGFDSTTGLEAMDYRFSDPYITPPHWVRHNREKIVYLSSLMRWSPPELELFSGPLPFLKNGYITFGCSNALFKINPRVIKVWAAILKEMPTAKLALKARQLDDLQALDFVKTCFSKHQISDEQLCFKGATSSEEHIRFNQRIDIALDPFPYNGGVTSCEILWMGVPFITLAEGSCSGKSILSVLGLPDLIAMNEAEYIQHAMTLAKDMEKLKKYRQTLRSRLVSSIICNGNHFVREIENIYESLFKALQN